MITKKQLEVECDSARSRVSKMTPEERDILSRHGMVMVYLGDDADSELLELVQNHFDKCLERLKQ